jgi:hypothetical protein
MYIQLDPSKLIKNKVTIDNLLKLNGIDANIVTNNI